MAGPDLALLGMLIFSIFKLVRNYKKTRKTQDNEVMPMIENKNTTAKVKKFVLCTLYNAMCGSLGNVITKFGSEMLSLKNHR